MGHSPSIGAALAFMVLCGVAGSRASAGEPPSPAWVLIVANNRSLDPAVTPLRFADDDGARWYELLAPAARRISLFTVLDAESQRVFRELAPRAEPPTRAAVMDRLAQYNVEMAAARKAGARPVLYLVLIGHGEVDSAGEGYLSLLDGKLGRGQLFRELIAPSQASFNHLIIDACNAWLLVSRRGGDDRGRGAIDAVRRYLADEDLERHPETGVVLATSRAQATHEWSVYGGGIFSHELRSALAGAADVNGDGRVEYSEVRAFVAAANLRVDDPRARLDVFVRPPALDRGRPLLDLAASRYAHFLRLPSEARGRFWLEDARGVRYADLNKSDGRPLLLALVDSERYFLRGPLGEVALRLGAPGTIALRLAQLVPRTTAERGSVEQAFQRHLFETGFDADFYRGHVASVGDLSVDDPPRRRFEPEIAIDSVERGPLERRLAAAKVLAREAGIRRGDLPFVDLLFDWSASRLQSGDLREADRALRALEHRLLEPASRSAP